MSTTADFIAALKHELKAARMTYSISISRQQKYSPSFRAKSRNPCGGG